MKSFNISLPSKTFLTGEYLALLDGPAILLNTKARFENKFTNNSEKDYYANPIEDDENPLHEYWNANEDFLLDFDYDFIDPYEGRGGFGASSAQWAAFYAFVNQYHPSMSYFFDKTQNENDFTKKIDFAFIENFLKTYRSYTKEGIPPSGYDVLSQWIGKVAYIDVGNKILKRFDWPFDGLSFVLIKNTDKIATHEHLLFLSKNLNQIPEKKLRACVDKNLKAFETKNQSLLIEGINENFEVLKEAKLVDPKAQRAIEKLQKNEFVLAAKGCGALGADVFCALVKTENIAQFVNYGVSENMNLIAAEVDLSHGIEVHTDYESQSPVLH